MGVLINGKMPEHIKAGLRCRAIGDVKCSECAYYGTVLYEIGPREYECDNIEAINNSMKVFVEVNE